MILYGLKRADTYIQYTIIISCGIPDLQNLRPSRLVLERLRKRDLFCFVGEVILSPEQRADLLRRGKEAGAGDIGEQARREMLAILAKKNQGSSFAGIAAEKIGDPVGRSVVQYIY